MAMNTTAVLVTPYVFHVYLDAYRDRGVLANNTPDPYFSMFVLDRGRAADAALLHRFHGPEPLEELYTGVTVWATRAELRRWTNTQNAVLEELRQAAEELLSGLDTAGALAHEAALSRCHARFGAVGKEHEPVWNELWARIEEAMAPRWPVKKPDTPERRAARKYNETYGGGYSSG